MTIIGQRPDRGGTIARKVGEKLLVAQEKVQISYAEKQALRRDRARPALDRASHLLTGAEGDLAIARANYEAACEALLLREVEEADVAAIEHEIADLERIVGRYGTAVRALERQLNIMRDTSGVILR